MQTDLDFSGLINNPLVKRSQEIARRSRGKSPAAKNEITTPREQFRESITIKPNGIARIRVGGGYRITKK